MIKLWHLCFLTTAVLFTIVNGAAIKEDVDQQGLYSKSDFVEILTYRNFEKKVYGQPHALLVQFYNSYCGHCRAFAPKFKELASNLSRWKNLLKMAVMDCSIEENNEFCRQFEVMAYPTLRYLHENYAKGNGNVGEKIPSTDTAAKLKGLLVQKLLTEKVQGRLPKAPSFTIASYSSYENALANNPPNIQYTFLIFEAENSTIGPELALDISNYKDIVVKRVHETSELAGIVDINKFPGLVAVRSTLESTNLTPDDPSKADFLKIVDQFLTVKHFNFPKQELNEWENKPSDSKEKLQPSNPDVVYYSDLETTLQTSLHTEITRHKVLTGEALQALKDYLDVLIISFPAKGNLRDYLIDLRNTVGTKSSWDGNNLYDTVKRLEVAHAPVFSSDLDYIGCKGSLPQYRGYTCGLWTLFHTLTVNGARRTGKEGPRILKAMHGYVKHFFGCTECSQHFQAMAERNYLFDVKENDKAVLWLWISHNEVNLRLAGDSTEDPAHPKIQFPSISSCPECRLARGAWNLPAVYEYLQNRYGSENIRDTRHARATLSAPSPLSNLDIGMLSLLYNSP